MIWIKNLYLLYFELLINKSINIFQQNMIFVSSEFLLHRDIYLYIHIYKIFIIFIEGKHLSINLKERRFVGIAFKLKLSNLRHILYTNTAISKVSFYLNASSYFSYWKQRERESWSLKFYLFSAISLYHRMQVLFAIKIR